MDIILLSSLWMKGPGSLGHVQSHNVDPRQGRVWIKTLTRTCEKPLRMIYIVQKLATLSSAILVLSSAVGDEHYGSALLTYSID